MSGHSAENDAPLTPLTVEQIEELVEEVIEANSIWPDPLPSQVSAVMDVIREAMEQAWERGNNDGLTFAAAPQKSLLTNPYRCPSDWCGPWKDGACVDCGRPRRATVRLRDE